MTIDSKAVPDGGTKFVLAVVKCVMIRSYTHGTVRALSVAASKVLPCIMILCSTICFWAPVNHILTSVFLNVVFSRPLFI